MPGPAEDEGGSSAGGFAARAFGERPAPAAREGYAIHGSATGLVAATLSWWAGDLARLALIGAIPVFTYAALMGTAVLFAGVGVLAMIGGLMGMPVWTWIAAFGVAFVLTCFTVTTWCAAMAGTILAADDHARGQRSFGVWSAFLHGLAGLKRVVPAALLLTFAFLAAASAASVPPLVAHTIAPGVGELVGWATSLAWFVAVLCVGGRLAPLVPVYLIEERALIDGIRRAWTMTRGRVVTILGAGVLLTFVSMAATFALAVVGTIETIGPVLVFAGLVTLLPIAHVFWFSIYAMCVNDSREAQ